jgi:hypothetical protein
MHSRSTRVCSCVPACLRACLRACLPACVRACVCACVSLCIHHQENCGCCRLLRLLQQQGAGKGPHLAAEGLQPEAYIILKVRHSCSGGGAQASVAVVAFCARGLGPPRPGAMVPSNELPVMHCHACCTAMQLSPSC